MPPLFEVKTCSHGLTDMVRLTDRTTVENYETGERTTIYGFYCPVHNAHGHHTVHDLLPKKDADQARQ